MKRTNPFVAAALVSFACLSAPSLAKATTVATQSELLGLFGSYTFEDFESFTNDDRTIFSGPLTSETTIESQGPGLVAPGAAYSTADNFQANVDGYYGLMTRTLGSGPVDIVYTQSVTAMGFDLHGYDGFNSQGTVSVYDLSDELLYSGAVSGGVGGANTFFGFENAGGIGRVVLETYGYIMIDNHAYGVTSASAVPLPAALPLLVAGLGGLAAASRRRRG